MVISHNNDVPIFTYHADFSLNYGAVQCWTLDASYWEKLRELIHDIAYYKNAINIHHDLSPKWMQRDGEDVKEIIDVVNENFLSPPFEKQELTGVSIGV